MAGHAFTECRIPAQQRRFTAANEHAEEDLTIAYTQELATLTRTGGSRVESVDDWG
jgi:hypothetical protein